LIRAGTNTSTVNTPDVTLVGPDGVSRYNMADFDNVGQGRQDAADDSLAYYARTVAGTLVGTRGIDPDGMVTMGFGTNYALKKPPFNGFRVYCPPACDGRIDYRYPGRPAKVQSALSFIDLHVYPEGPYSIGDDLRSSEVHWLTKPYLLGELGAKKVVYANNIRVAAVDMKNKQVNSCSIGNYHGLGAKGWLFWTYDSDIVVPDLEDQGLFYALASEGGAINGLLAPSRRPNPCVP
jgi:hypothetical protein